MARIETALSFIDNNRDELVARFEATGETEVLAIWEEEGDVRARMEIIEAIEHDPMLNPVWQRYVKEEEAVQVPFRTW